MKERQRFDIKRIQLTLAIGSALVAFGAIAVSGPEPEAEKGFAAELPSQCLVLKDGKLEKFDGDFADKKLLAVYYSHTQCGSCRVYTKFLNSWLRDEAPKFPGVQLLFATRGDETRAALTKYVAKSEIRYPVLDEKFYVQADIDQKEEVHPFYSDADMGVPRIRFFDMEGHEIPVRDYVKSIYNADETIKGLSKLLKKLKAE